MKIEYKGVEYPVRMFKVSLVDLSDKPLVIRIAPTSLYEAMGGKGPFADNSLEESIDDSISYYLENDLLELDAITICHLHLDITVKLIEEVL